DLEKAKNIYEYVRSNFACSDYSGLWTSQLLKNVMKTKKGNVADINLLLTAMLRHAGLKAYPVILSTTGHGYVSELYPMISSFNYVITQLKEGGKTYYLDASRNRLGFGKLMPTCFNGHARVVDDSASRIVLTADSLKERKVTSLFLTNSEKNKWVGSMNQTAGYYESYSIREKIAESGTDAFFKQVQKDFGADVRIENPRIDSISRLEMPVALKYGVELDYAGEDILYVNPMFGEGYKKNPFTSAQRYYPVEMPYTIDETFLLTLEVPDGYEVDELPKQLVAKLDDQESASFEFRLSQSGRTISMRSRIKISRTLFLPEEYETLREFFNLIVSKHNEQIVFKKK
ncbi:MAG TPA: DUF3858 domain-containing protein, partial [Flavisolibacter sp.]|nr:DUF3858 domain-containing protein [Flavisolibacter sp.]